MPGTVFDSLSDIRALVQRLASQNGFQKGLIASTRMGYAGALSDGVITAHCSQRAFLMMQECCNPRFAFHNLSSTGNFETPNPDAIEITKVSCLVSNSSSMGPVKCYFGTETAPTRAITMPAAQGDVVYTRPLGLYIQGPVASTINDAGASTTVFITTLPADAPLWNVPLIGDAILFTSGQNKGAYRMISAYNTSTGSVTVGTAFKYAPANGDTIRFIKVLYCRCLCTVAGGAKFPYTNYHLAFHNDGFSNSVDSVDSGAPTITSGYSFGPIAVMANYTPTQPVFACVGDSIDQGSNEGANCNIYRGYFVRTMLRAGWSSLHICKSGELSTDFILSKTLVRLALVAGCTHAICGYGTNDLGSTVAAIKASLLTVWRSLAMHGIQTTQRTLLPKSTSTDNFITATNQTVQSHEATRLSINAWLRDATSTGAVAMSQGALKGILDVCSFIEVNSSNVLTLNGGFWRAPAAASFTGTATAGSTTTLTDSGATWEATVTNSGTAGMVNWVVEIFAGTGSGQTAIITTNTATILTFAALGTGLDNTSQYRIWETYGNDGTHPTSLGHKTISDNINIGQFRL